MTNLERVSYIRGLMEGLELDENKKEVRVIKAMVELLEDMALSIEDVEEANDVLNEVVDEIDEDLAELEEDYYGDTDLDDYDELDDDLDDDEAYFYEVTCPTCGDTICLTENIIDDGSIDCPNCGETLVFDMEDEQAEAEESEEETDNK